MLHYCPTCKEKSICKKTYTKANGEKSVFEFCINKNPKCRYKHHRVLSPATKGDYEIDPKKGEAVVRSPGQGAVVRDPRQYMLFEDA